MNKLKVIQLLPELNIGGVERGTKDFSRALVEKGHDSIVISNGGLFEQDIQKDGARHIKLPIHKKSLFSLFLSRKLKSIYKIEKPDIVHVRSRMPAWINFYAFKKLSKKPILVSTFHGLYSTPIYSQIMSKVDHIIAISKTVKEYITNTYNIPSYSRILFSSEETMVTPSSGRCTAHGRDTDTAGMSGARKTCTIALPVAKDPDIRTAASP